MKRCVQLSLTALSVIWLSACSNSKSVDDRTDSVAKVPARFRTQLRPLMPDFTEAARDPTFQLAIKEASVLLGSQPKPLETQGESAVVKGGVCFEVPAAKLETILFQAHTNFLAKGFYLFRCEQHFAFGGIPDKVGLVPTEDKYSVMAAMDTNGDNYEIGTCGVMAWMKELEAEQPYLLTGIGFDYMEGIFTARVRNPTALAKRMYEFCPDIVDQGVNSVAALARELEKGKLYFWWD